MAFLKFPHEQKKCVFVILFWLNTKGTKRKLIVAVVCFLSVCEKRELLRQTIFYVHYIGNE